MHDPPFAALIVTAAGISVVVHRRTAITAGAVVGSGTGAALLGYAACAAALVVAF